MSCISCIRNFKSNGELIYFLHDKNIQLIGTGSEGSCFKGMDNYAYKLFNKYVNNYKVKKVITEEEFELESFAFPKELYVVNNVLRAYKTKYIKKDLFAVNNTIDLKTINIINFDSLSNAYKIMLNDIRKISKHNILIEDLAANLLFDGEKLIAIDTCQYRRINKNSLDSNIFSLNDAIESIFNEWFESEHLNAQIKGTDIDKYLVQVYESIPVSVKDEIKMKRHIKLSK